MKMRKIFFLLVVSLLSLPIAYATGEYGREGYGTGPYGSGSSPSSSSSSSGGGVEDALLYGNALHGINVLMTLKIELAQTQDVEELMENLLKRRTAPVKKTGFAALGLNV